MLARYHDQMGTLPSLGMRSADMIRSNLPVSPESAAAAGIQMDSTQKVVRAWPFSDKSDLDTHLEPFSSPLIVFTCQRPQYLAQTLADVYKYRDSTCRMGCPLIISQDGRDEGVVQIVQEYQQKFANVGIPLIHLIHDEQPTYLRKSNAYELLAVHYGWALGQVFGDQLESKLVNTI